MKTIKIKSITLVNFKGIKDLSIDLGEETKIFGANASGKTTLFDAFTWLLFGKDSTDRTAFEIKTLDENNQVIPKIDHEVEAVIDVDGKETIIKRTFREKWVKRRGSLEAEFSGNETLYHWNDVPVTASEFTSKINAIIPESIFKLLTNPLGFNSLKWQDQRQLLIEISGGVTNNDIAGSNPEYQSLLEKLTDKSLDEYKKQIHASIKKSKAELKMLPTRIDEVERGKPEALDFVSLKTEIMGKTESLRLVEEQITDHQKAHESILNGRAKKKEQIQKLEFEISDIKHRIAQEVRDKKRASGSEAETLEKHLKGLVGDLELYTNSIDDLKNQVLAKNNKVRSLEDQASMLRAKWEAKNAEKLDISEIETACPTCKREFEEGKLDQEIAKAESNFKANKLRELERIQMDGISIKKSIEAEKEAISRLNDRIENGNNEVAKLSDEIAKLKEELEATKGSKVEKSEEEMIAEAMLAEPKIEANKTEINRLTEELNSTDSSMGGNEDLKSKRVEIQSEIERLKSQLSAEAQIQKANERIEELQKEESALAQVIADLEKEQYIIENFTKDKIDRLEGIINARFEHVKFKMFETQVNGAEVETCKALINGVPFSDANNAAKINAGLDIISTLCKHYQVSAPIWIDNRESVTTLIDIDSQIINLIVSEPDKKLRIEAMEKELASA